MRITKFGHCCLLIETGGIRILTDPGSYNEAPETAGIDAILITHEHPDHCHIPALREILERNPDATIMTHPGVGKLLDEAGIPYIRIAEGEEKEFRGVPIESSGSEHACIHADLPPVQNTGFLIDRTLFYPGDSFHQPGKPVRLLALPVSGPWMRLSEAIEYAKIVHPEAVFPVHDGMIRPEWIGVTRRIPEMLLSPLGIRFIEATEGSEIEF